MKRNAILNPIFTTASLVTLLSVAERGLGFLYRIVLSRLIGAEGMGLYQIALSHFAIFLTIGTGGIPIVVSRMISKSKATNDLMGERNAVSAGGFLSLLLTLPIALFLIFFGKDISFFSDERAFPVLQILLIGLTFSSLYAVIRGSFWGNKRFLAPSLLELAEESVMVIAGILLLQNVSTPMDGAIRAAYAVVISYLFSFSAASICFSLLGGKLSSPKKALKPVFNATLPITSVRACSSLINSAIAILLPVMLVRAGVDNNEALALFGIVSGMVLPVVFIPSTLIGSLSLVLVPEVAEDFFAGNTHRLTRNVERGLLFAFLIACILTPLFFVLGEEIGGLAFANEKAGELIKYSAPLLLPMSLSMISTSILNSMGFEKKTFLFYFLSAGGLLLCILFLPPFCGIYAYLIGLGVSFTLQMFFNLVLLCKVCPIFKKQWGQVWIHGIFPSILSVSISCFLGNVLLPFTLLYCKSLLALFFTGAFVTLLCLLCFFLLKKTLRHLILKDAK